MGANAVTTVPVYVAGEVLTAADLNITNSGIPVFAGTTERDAAFGGTGEKTLAEGQFAYLETGNVTQYYDGATWQAVAGGKVAQVVSTVKTDTFSTTSTSYVDVTGFSVSITPSSASSKVLVVANFTVGNAGAGVDPFWQLVRTSTAIFIGDAAGSRTRGSTGGRATADAATASNSLIFLDSPATTSATTYKLQAASNTATTIYVNRSQDDADQTARGRFASSITVMEILA
jgi:hypothetical protein